MRPPVRRSRTRVLALTGLTFFMFSISFVFLAIVPADFSPPLQHKELIGDNSIAWKTSEKLNSRKQEISGGLKVPPGIVLKDNNYHELVNDLRDDVADEEVKQQNRSTFADGMEQSNHVSVGVHGGLPRQHPVINEKVSEMEDQIIMARAYLQFTSANSNSHLASELKQRIREMQKILGHARGANLPRGLLLALFRKAFTAFPCGLPHSTSL